VDAYRQRTVETATRLFAEHGYDGVTMRRIARELGGSAMTPYRYFKNKAEIFDLVRAALFGRFADAQKAAYDSAGDPASRLLAMRNAYMEFALNDPQSYRLMFELGQDEVEEREEVAEQGARAFSYLLRAVEDAASAGMVDGDPLTVAHTLWGQVHGLLTLHLAGKLNLGRTLEQLLDAPSLVIRPGGTGRPR